MVTTTEVVGEEGMMNGVPDWAVNDGPVRDSGSATTEYALVTLAAAGFAGVLVALLKSPEVRGWLMGLIGSALGQ